MFIRFVAINNQLAHYRRAILTIHDKRRDRAHGSHATHQVASRRFFFFLILFVVNKISFVFT